MILLNMILMLVLWGLYVYCEWCMRGMHVHGGMRTMPGVAPAAYLTPVKP